MKQWVLNNQWTDRNTMYANADRLTKEELEFLLSRRQCSRTPLLPCARTTGSTASTPAPMVEEMPGWPTANYFSASVLKHTNQSAVDEAAARFLTSMFRLDLPSRTKCWVPHCASLEYADFTSPAHTTLARALDAESVVLLKDAHETLPLTATGLLTLAVIGLPAAA